jgi:rod shape determining protein RodA
VYRFRPFNLVYAAYAGLVLTTGYLLWLSIKMWSKVYLLIAFFIFGSVGFTFSVDYVFDEILESHQQERIMVTLGMKDDPGGAGYNVNQSRIAIGSGGFSGKGFLSGTQTKLKYVPEQDTDFIFCTIGEEKGFLGSALVLVLFAVLIVRLILRAERQRESFNRIYGYSVAAILFFHLAINIGMVIGLTPVIGIPLPFFSYGGSSLWGFTILLFIFLKLDAEKT